MKYAPFLLALALASGISHAAEISSNSAPLKASGTSASDLQSSRVMAVTSSGTGQTGFVHYFLITHADESLEYHVGVELEDQRIAWSFPNAGVIVSEFIKNGTINANGKNFKIEHLHGIRPFADDAQMRTLRKELPQRVAQWVDNETPYCLFRKPGEPFCLSCGDFVVHILYPGTHPLVAALPRDFRQASSTNDLLLYLVGIYNLPNRHAKLARLTALNLPANMRDDIIAMIDDGEPDAPDVAIAATAATAVAKVSPAPTPAKPALSKIASRRQQNRKL